MKANTTTGKLKGQAEPKEWELLPLVAICFHLVWCLYWCRAEHFEQCVSVRLATSASASTPQPPPPDPLPLMVLVQ